VISYIHQNPAVAGLVENMEDYKYSSCPAYLSKKETIINKQEVLDWFGGIDSFIDHHKMLVDELEIDRHLKLSLS
jgi:putative transposase